MTLSYEDRRVWQNIDTQLKDELILKLISNLECSICSEVMHVPFLASCGHSFCYGCLDLWFETKVNCPTCRKEMTEAPILNISLKENAKAITDLVIETLEDSKYKTELSESRAQLIRDYETASRSKSLFGKAFSSAPTLVDTSDGVPRCGNCHWEAHGSVCLNCGVQFRHPRNDSYYDSEDGDAYNEDDDEADMYGIAGSEDAYDSADSFVDNRDVEEVHDNWDGDQDSDNLETYSDDSRAGNWEEEVPDHAPEYDDDSIDCVYDEVEEWENRAARGETSDWYGDPPIEYVHDEFDEDNWHPRETQRAWQRFSDDEDYDSTEETVSPEIRMQRLHLRANGLRDELDERHESDVEHYNNTESGRRRRQVHVISSDSE